MSGLSTLADTGPLDGDAARHSVLILDSNAASRSILSSMLRDAGFNTIRQAARAGDGLSMLSIESFDLVICDSLFEAEGLTGGQVLARIRREMLLPFTSVVMLLSSAATHTQVLEAAEFAADSVLLKPFAAKTLLGHLLEARERKRALSEVYAALELGEVAQAIALCLESVAHRCPYWLNAARIGAELLLQQDRSQEARSLYDAIAQAKAVPWARLGLIRTHFAEGSLPKAKKAAQALLEEDPENADAHAMLGRVHVEAGALAQALESYSSALELTPHCPLRVQITGSLSFYSARPDEALALLDRSWTLSRGTHLLDALSIVQCSYLKFETRQTSALRSSVEALHDFARANPTSFRLRHFCLVGAVLLDLAYGRSRDAVERSRAVHRPVMEPNFDFEAGLNTLALMVRLLPFHLPEDSFEAVTRSVARRFASKPTVPFLHAVVEKHAAASQWISEESDAISRLSEKGVDLSMNGKPREAVEFLITTGDAMRNGRLIDLAGHLVRRHRSAHPELSEVVGKLGHLKRRYGSMAAPVAGLRRSIDSSGGLLLRPREAGSETAAVAQP
jgi:tetratricopeptide (TPR) repeat protein